MVLADVQVLRPCGVRRAGAGMPVAAPVGGSAVGPAGLGPPSADAAAQHPGQPVLPPAGRVFALGADALDCDEVLLADQRGVRRAGRDHPAVGKAPPLHLPVPEAGVGGVNQVHSCGLPVPHLAASVTGVGQDRPHRGQRPPLPRAVRVPIRVGRGRARDARLIQRPGDPRQGMPGRPLREDPPHDLGGLRVRLQPPGAPPHAACALFGCGPASASRYPYGGRPPR